jgi:hypothetical protein
MPTIAWFYGIAIQMYYNDHNPPHFHARYGRARAIVRISDGEVISGDLPPTRCACCGNGPWHGAKNWSRIGNMAARTSRWSGLRDPMTVTDFPMVDVVRLKPLDGRKLWLRFSDGCEGIRDLSELISQGGPMVAPLEQPDYFNRVFIEMGAPTWPNGFDLDAIQLYMELRDAQALAHAAAE